MRVRMVIISCLFAWLPAAALAADELVVSPSSRPVVPGKLLLHVRERKETAPGSGKIQESTRDVEWKVAETAIIVCDMWDDNPCQLSAHRVDVMAPEMNRVVSAARNLGVLIIHSPSNGMKHYEDTPFRQRVLAAPLMKPPVPIEAVCLRDPLQEAAYPIPETTTVAEGCDDPVYGGDRPISYRQHAAIKMIGYDGVSDNGVEIFNFFEQQGIKNVVLMGVHTHHCVLGRSFGIRQMVRLGKQVVLARDLTDAMYDPRKPPYVSHTRGTELAVEHIEHHWCPSILSQDLTKAIPGSADPPSTDAEAK